jgi:hypothetical protein
VVNITYLANSSPAPAVKLTQLTRREFKYNILAFLVYNLGRTSCAMNKLPPLAWLKLNIMHQSSHRNGLQWQSIPKFYINIFACLYDITQLNAQRSEYIALFSVSIMN